MGWLIVWRFFMGMGIGAGTVKVKFFVPTRSPSKVTTLILSSGKRASCLADTRNLSKVG
jgi:hypothetical protein